MNKIAQFISYSLLVAIIIISIVLVILPMTGNQLLSVQSGSMSPSINAGDMVYVTSVPNSSLKVGDVITYTNPSNPESASITHRIVELPSRSNNNKLVLRGDANQATDEPIDPALVIGKVSATIPYAGYGLRAIYQPIGLILLIYLPAILIIIHEIKLLSRHFENSKPWRHPSLDRREQQSNSMPKLMVVMAIPAVVALLLVPSTFARLNDSVQLTGNTISSANLDDNDDNGAVCNFDANSNQSNFNLNINGSGSSSSTTININNNTNQSATSGNVNNSGNTNSGNASSGDASNCNSTNIDIIINN